MLVTTSHAGTLVGYTGELRITRTTYRLFAWIHGGRLHEVHSNCAVDGYGLEPDIRGERL